MKQEKGNGHIRPCTPLGGSAFHNIIADGNDQIGPVEQLVHIVILGDADGPQAVLVIHGEDALCHHGIHHRDVQPVGAHLAGDGHQRRTVRIGVREAHHKKARSSKGASR